MKNLTDSENEVAIIGGGPAGIMAAITASKRGKKVTLFEKRERPLRKLLITGNGRCNLTNNCDVNELISNVVRNGRFLYSSFSELTPNMLMNFFEDLGAELKTERGKRVFPVSNKAIEIVDRLYDEAKRRNITFSLGKTLQKIELCDGKFMLQFSEKEKYLFNNVILATGGASYPLTGSSGDGQRVSKLLGHNISPLRPALVPLESHDEVCRGCQGLALKNVGLLAYDSQNKKVYEDFGEILFTHFGLSGPMAISASSYMNFELGKYKIVIDLKPALSEDTLDKRLLRDFEANAKKQVSNVFGGLLPGSLIPYVAKRADISLDKKVSEVTKRERAELIKTLKAFEIELHGTRPIDEAIVTAGGVFTKEINPKTMESKLISGLYFAGEVIDVDALTGGFNLQIAFSTGFVAGNSV